MEETTAVEAGVVEEAETSIEELDKVINQPEPEPEEEQSQDTEEESTDEPATEDEEDDEEKEPEEYEFDFGGNKLRVDKSKIPAELAEEVQKFGKGIWSDYTKKSQAHAESVKSMEAREQAVQKLSQMQGDTLAEYSKGLQISGELEQLRQVDLTELWQSKPDQARQVSDRISTLTQEFNNTVSKVDQLEQASTTEQANETARRMEEGKKLVERKIKGYGQRADEVVDYVVKNYDVTPENAKTWPLNPTVAVMAYKAMMFDKMQSKVKATTKNKPTKATPVTPIASKAGKPRKDPDKMSNAEWLAWRNKNKKVR